MRDRLLSYALHVASILMHDHGGYTPALVFNEVELGIHNLEEEARLGSAKIGNLG